MKKKVVKQGVSKAERKIQNVRIVLYALTIKRWKVAELAKCMNLSRATVNSYITILCEQGFAKPCKDYGYYCASKSGQIAGNTLFGVSFLYNAKTGMDLSLSRKMELASQLSFFNEITELVEMVGK